MSNILKEPVIQKKLFWGGEAGRRGGAGRWGERGGEEGKGRGGKEEGGSGEGCLWYCWWWWWEGGLL